MHAGRIAGATRSLGPPEGWDHEKQGRCTSLHIRDEATTAGHAMTSAWFPTPEEMRRIAAGAPVYLTVFARAHPPIQMAVGPAPDGPAPQG